MENNENFNREAFQDKLQPLNPQVREKAVSIAQKLAKKENYLPNDAIDEAIRRAEEWFYDLEG
ncbi:MAG TPA: hypothetical protein ENH91_01165 [Leeuwenhoekiella sp.]|nr:hypothetical protein [Leeuwenhoekiella sp.]